MKNEIDTIKNNSEKTVNLEANKLYKDIETFTKELIRKKEATQLFAQEKNKGNLEGIFGNILSMRKASITIFEVNKNRESKNIIYWNIEHLKK